jgi:hypothetical protein
LTSSRSKDRCHSSTWEAGRELFASPKRYPRLVKLLPGYALQSSSESENLAPLELAHNSLVQPPARVARNKKVKLMSCSHRTAKNSRIKKR